LESETLAYEAMEFEEEGEVAVVVEAAAAAVVVEQV
jgi:hypothetical protein